jgi:D-cysteine desulfhydrase
MGRSLPEPSYPTPLRRLDDLSSEQLEVWVKDDGFTHPTYGGNKVRKVVGIVQAAHARGARRILTFGPGGSHHALATALFARAHGLECAAVLVPQPASEHAIDTLRAGLAAGLTVFPAPSKAALPIALARAFRAGDAVVPPGGASIGGAAAYSDALQELLQQFAARGERAPDRIVVPLGTGGTAAGLLAGVSLRSVPTVVQAVSVMRNPFARLTVSELAARVVRRLGGAPDRARLRAQLCIDSAQIGPGYGRRTEASVAAVARAAQSGLSLDPSYTAKAFAALLEIVRTAALGPGEPPLRVVYWHTLSAAPLEPLLRDAPAWDELARDVRRLFVGAERD